MPFGAVVLAVSLGACAPTNPSVLVLPPAGKSLDEFGADDLACRQWAQRQGGGQRQFDMAYLQCMYAKGNQIPGPRVPRSRAGATAPAGPPAESTAPPPASGAPAPPAPRTE